MVTVLLSLTFIGIVCWCAKRLGRDPRYAAVLVGLNPIYLVFAVGGFHNDFFMLVPSTAAIAFLLARRDKSRGSDADGRGRGQIQRRAAPAFPACGGAAGAAPAQVLYGCVARGDSAARDER